MIVFCSRLDQTPTATNGANNGAGGQLVPPPLTPGTNNKMTEALQATFASWEKERHLLNVPKGNVRHNIILCTKSLAMFNVFNDHEFGILFAHIQFVYQRQKYLTLIIN